MEAKLKHLEFAQNIITRMATNSFWVKGWSVTLVSAILALAVKGGNAGVVPVALLPVIVFWFLDAYFLRQERLYRKLYDFIRLEGAEEVDFSLDASRFAPQVAGYAGVMVSITLRWFHGVLLFVVLTVTAVALLR